MIPANNNSLKVNPILSHIDSEGSLTLINICGPLRPGGAWSRNFVVSDLDSRVWSCDYVVMTKAFMHLNCISSGNI